MKKRIITFATLRALDNSLRQATTKGLAAFVPDADKDRDVPLSKRPKLVTHFDEASPDMSLDMWLRYKAKARLVAIRDAFHSFS